MAEQNQNPTPETTEAEEKAPSKFKSFINKHPRATKVVGITAGVTAVVGLVAAMKNSDNEEVVYLADISEPAPFDSTPETTQVAEA
jgi:hypothetical protein